MSIIYLTLEQAIEVHRKTVEVSGGGAMGHLELGKLESVLEHIQNDDYYPTFEDKLTHLFSVLVSSIVSRMATKESRSLFVLRCFYLMAISIAQASFSARWKTSVTMWLPGISAKSCWGR